ncbi:Dcg1p PWA37_005453 [Arxiozyma heterogenica]
MYGNQSFSIITSNKEWVPILKKSVEKNLLTNYVLKNNLWKGTVTTNLQDLDLHDSKNFNFIAKKIERENLNKFKSKLVILGCAGFQGLIESLTSKFNNKVEFVDPIIINVRLLVFSNGVYAKIECSRINR